MAVLPKVAFHEHSPAQSMDIDAWTEHAAQSLNPISISSPQTLRGTTTPLAIKLDETYATKSTEAIKDERYANETSSTLPSRREPLRRDSLKRRDALLKGKEGSRQRRRWENDQLLNNPWAQPPLPSDWEIHPTYPKHTVPYYLAPLWDTNLAARALEERQEQKNAHKSTSVEEQNAKRVPRELRGKFKKAKAAKGLLQDLEEQVRAFVKSWEEKMKNTEKDWDSEDEEIVFVGRNGQMHDIPLPDEPPKDQLLFESLASDQGASFGRWLVHNIATYYGLRTWSVTVGDPARREAYIGIKDTKRTGLIRTPASALPRPLWGLV
ncbi:MAG: hypothetical protein Q9195_003701 [Heterodermia aff. obscurata]